MLDRALAYPALLTALLAATSALADDAADCAAGIAMIRGEIARAEAASAPTKASGEPALAKLRKALRVAEREQGEREFDECLDAVGDAKRALAR